MHLIHPLRLILFVIRLQTIAALALLPNEASTLHGTGSDLFRRRGGERRSVTLIADVDLEASDVSPTTGKPLLSTHSAVHLSGTSVDGPLRVELLKPSPWEWAVRALDWGPENSDKPIAPTSKRYHRKLFELGYVDLRNADIIDPATGKGLLLDTWTEDPVFRPGSNDCNKLAQRLVAGMNLQIPEAARPLLAQAAEFGVRQALGVRRDALPLFSERIVEWGNSAPHTRIEFDIEDPRQPRLVAALPSEPSPEILAETPRQSIGNDAPLSRLPSPFAELAEDPWERVSTASDSELAAQRYSSRDLVFLARTHGATSLVSIALERTLRVAGVAGFIAAPAFIILDIVRGEWRTAAIGAVGLAAGVASALAIAGPIGWVFGGVVSLFFAILPGLFDLKEPPSPRNVTQIIQWAMFGDKDHTGNEKCQTMGNANCTAVYGPGVMASVFKWETFDAFIFMIHYNEGYAMSLPDIAKVFYVKPSSAGRDDGADKIATIDCNVPRDRGRFSGPTSPPKKCIKPTFALKRQLVTIPFINQTADHVYKRIIPQPDGDCKLLNDVANGFEFINYNLTVTGRPVAIACNISAALNVSGTAVPIDDGEGMLTQPAHLVSPAISSTDGSGGRGFVAPPPKSPFASILNISNAVCLNGTKGHICLPNGTYRAQLGDLGFDFSKVTNITVPAGASLNFIRQDAAGPRNPTKPVRVDYTSDRNAASPSFVGHMRWLSGHEDRLFNVMVPSDPPVACFFQGPSFRGEVACFGPGGGDLPEPLQKSVQSISAHGNTTVWLYAKHYGDEGGVSINTNVEDLTVLPYGSKDNFNKKTVAIWIHT
ncbi:MAG: hypothetical protein M1817_002202 [Caeruleum heppii]|nr:MAG: hypothetical protein M1817_002202 [Caeruleum heppii]